jgi:hypothetical protein
VRETPSEPDVAWRHDERVGQSYALVITHTGREAIDVGD